VLANATAREVLRREQEGRTEHADFAELVAGTLARDRGYRQGDTDSGMLSKGPAVGFINEVEPIGAIVERLMAEAAAALARLDRLRG
jgi:nitronate monooxygenase